MNIGGNPRYRRESDLIADGVRLELHVDAKLHNAAGTTLVVVNLGDAPAAGNVSLRWDDLRGRSWRLADALSDAVYERSGDDLRDGLYVALDPWASNLFDLAALDSPEG